MDREGQYGSGHILFADAARFHSSGHHAWVWSRTGVSCEMPVPGGKGEKRNWPAPSAYQTAAGECSG